MGLRLSLRRIDWPLREPFRIARGTQFTFPALQVGLSDASGNCGRGEAMGILNLGETPETMARELEAVRDAIENGISRSELCALLPPGGARCAVDCALWDLEAQQSGRSVIESCGLAGFAQVECAMTIGITPLSELDAKIRPVADFPLLKIKVDRTEPLAVLRKVHELAPRACLIVDPNQSWDFETLARLALDMADLNVILIEQPLSAAEDLDLCAYSGPVPLCADEAFTDTESINGLLGRYHAANIKLDKCGGLTEALKAQNCLRQAGLRVMIGCMGGSSLAMAPAAVLAGTADYVDLDGPLLQAADCNRQISYLDGRMYSPPRALWGWPRPSEACELADVAGPVPRNDLKRMDVSI